MSIFNNKNYLSDIYKFLSIKRKIHLYVLILLMIFSALAEVISLAAIIPFIGFISAPELALQNRIVQFIVKLLSIEDFDQMKLTFTILFIISALIAGLLRIGVLWVRTKFSVIIGTEISEEVYYKTLYQPYSVHVSRNSSELISAMIDKLNTLIFKVIIPALDFLSSLIILLFLFIALVILNWKIALSIGIIIGCFYFFVSTFVKSYLNKNSINIAEKQNTVVKLLQEGLGGIRDVLLSNTQSIYINKYIKSDFPLRNSIGLNAFIGASPRYIIEMVAIILIIVLSYYLSNSPGGITNALPLLGAMALGGQKILPAVQQCYAAWAAVRGFSVTTKDVVELLNQKVEPIFVNDKSQRFNFERSIAFEDLSFRFSNDTPWIIKNFNLKISKGSRVAIIGETGCGKSTLIDIISGLIKPTSGKVLIDNNELNIKSIRSWQKKLSYVPQVIFLSDNTIEKNIALGNEENEISKIKIYESANEAMLDSFISSLPNKYQTIIGERGNRLSGGQRQRLGLARSFYKNASVIFLDEATNALDEQTENEILKNIFSNEKDKTIFFITHKKNILAKFDIVLEFKNGNIKKIN